MNLGLSVNKSLNVSIFNSLNKKQRRYVSVAVLILGLSLLFFILLMPNNKEEKQFKEIGLVIGGNVIETTNKPIIQDNSILISFDDIKNNIDKNIAFDEKNKKVVVTTLDKVIRLKPDSNIGTINNKPFVISANMLMKGDMAYIPLDSFKEIYNIDVSYHKGSNVVVIDKRDADYTIGFVNSKNKSIRKPKSADDVKEKDAPSSIKQPIYKRLDKGESIRLYGEVNGWYKVRGSNGVIGYIQKKYVENVKNIKGIVVNGPNYSFWKPQTGKINLVWEQIENSTPTMDNVDKAEGLDVVSPTWFELVDGNGNIRNKVDSNYIRWARANGYKIWPLINNKFDPKITSSVLNNSDVREKTINEILRLVELFGLDGINIDFEHFDVNDKDEFTQFIRELTPLFRERSLPVSVDVTVMVQSDNSLIYDRRSLAQVADYIVAMTYDQHWSTDKESGSVAQYTWVDKNLEALLKQVPKEKLIMGIPFYTRLWIEKPSSRPKSQALTMIGAQNLIRQNNAKVEWDEASGQYYAEYMKGSTKYRIWVEDSKSINLKSSLVLKHNLAGAASWRRGYESSDIWNVLKKNLKDYKTYNEFNKNL